MLFQLSFNLSILCFIQALGNLVVYLSAEHEKKQSLEDTPAQHRCQIKLNSLVQQRPRCSATSITWKYLYSALTLQPGKSLQNQHSKSWASEVD